MPRATQQQLIVAWAPRVLRAASAGPAAAAGGGHGGSGNSSGGNGGSSGAHLEIHSPVGIAVLVLSLLACKFGHVLDAPINETLAKVRGPRRGPRARLHGARARSESAPPSRGARPAPAARRREPPARPYRGRCRSPPDAALSRAQVWTGMLGSQADMNRRLAGEMVGLGFALWEPTIGAQTARLIRQLFGLMAATAGLHAAHGGGHRAGALGGAPAGPIGPIGLGGNPYLGALVSIGGAQPLLFAQLMSDIAVQLDIDPARRHAAGRGARSARIDRKGEGRGGAGGGFGFGGGVAEGGMGWDGIGMG